MTPRRILRRAIYAVMLWKRAYVFVHIVVNEINANAVCMMLQPVADEIQYEINCKLIKAGK
jgi:hypothetical protein